MSNQQWLKQQIHQSFKPLRRLLGVEARLGESENRITHLENCLNNLQAHFEQRVGQLEGQIERKTAKFQRDLTMPTYLYHSPLDYELETHAPQYEDPIFIEGEPLPIPPPPTRPGYSPDNDQFYLEWGKSDHDLILSLIKKHYDLKDNFTLLDWGCSSGRVLRHFYPEMTSLNWELYGVDIQALLIEWMRRHFPPEINVMSVSTYPHLPFKDESIDCIYGISVFTHTKYLWDTWLAEFRRVLKPGGLCIQTVQCETAWQFYHQNQDQDWVKKGHPQTMLDKAEMDEDFFFYGDALVSQNFYKEEVIRQYWGRYLKVIDFLPPPKYSYQNWIVLQNS